MQDQGTAGAVVAPLKYLADARDVPSYVASVGGGDTSLHEGNYRWQSVEIRDGRRRGTPFDLDREGFVLALAPSRVADFYDDAQVSAVYEPEVRALVQRITGGREVAIFDHTRRAAARDLQAARQVREPADLVHNDYTANSAPKRLRDHFSADPLVAEDRLARRFAIVNVWRSIEGPVLSAPLALCDAASIPLEDLVSVTRQARDRIGEIQQAVHSPGHRWYYFPEMAPEEALLIKTFDSETDGRARFTLHTAFDDPAVSGPVTPRQSIETRCFVFF